MRRGIFFCNYCVGTFHLQYAGIDGQDYGTGGHQHGAHCGRQQHAPGIQGACCQGNSGNFVAGGSKEVLDRPKTLSYKLTQKRQCVLSRALYVLSLDCHQALPVAKGHS